VLRLIESENEPNSININAKFNELRFHFVSGKFQDLVLGNVQALV
jgi:hypothetical protein